jgi:TolB-like protein/DNA-binding winged helix-turn-helix (wHTH) protein/Flp pilus assembly protein TadD
VPVPAPAENPLLLRFGPFQLDLEASELRKGDTLLHLAPQPCKVLALLASRPQKVFTRQEIQREIWGGETSVDFEQGLNVAIRRIRVALCDDAETPRYIETLPKRGYRFIGQLNGYPAAVRGATPSVPAESATLSALRVPHPATYRRPATVMVGLLSVVVAVILVWRMERIPGRTPLTPIRSLAVLPLENLSPDAEQEYFADGMTDELITDLAKIHALRVISRDSVMQYKGKHKPTPQIARELNVDAVVEGTVIRSGNRVRITAQLIEGSQDRHLWAETYEGDLRDILSLQDQVAKAIAGEISVKLTPQEQIHLTNARRVDPQGQDAYLTGRYYWNRRTTEAMRKSCDYFQVAIDKDPTYAVAYAGLADCYNLLGYYDYRSPAETFALGKAAAQKALQIDESLAEAHASLAYDKYYYDFDWTGAEREYEKAIELNPNYATAHQWYSLYLSEVGRLEEAKAEIRRALELDPLSPVIISTIAAVYFRSREYDQGIQQLHKLLEADSNFGVADDLLGQFYMQKGMYDAAITEFQKAKTLDPGDISKILLEIGEAHALAGRKTEANNMLKEVKNISKRKYVPPYLIAQFYACMGQKDMAFEWLQRAYEGRDRSLTAFGFDPQLDNLRSDPRFADLLRRTGLSQ